MSWNINTIKSEETEKMTNDEMKEYYFKNQKELRKTFKYNPSLFGDSHLQTLENI